MTVEASSPAPMDEEGLTPATSEKKSLKEVIFGDSKNYPYKYLCMPQMPWGGAVDAPPFMGKDAVLPVMVAIIMGLQHCLAMLGGIITPPRLIANDACFPWQRSDELCDAKEYMISASLITSGLLTIIQVVRCKLFKGYYLGTGLISVMGTSFTFMPVFRDAVIQQINDNDGNDDIGLEAYGKVLGTVLVACFMEIGLSFVPPKVLRRMFPPLVTGTCVTLIGVALTSTGIKYWGGGVFCAENDLSSAPGVFEFNAASTYKTTITNEDASTKTMFPFLMSDVSPLPFNPGVGPPGRTPWTLCDGNGEVMLGYGAPEYVGLGFSVVVFLIFVQMFGSPFMKNSSVILALFFGYFVAGVSRYENDAGESLRYVTDAKIESAEAIEFLWTTKIPLGFYAPAFLPILIGFIVTTIESIGDIELTGELSGVEPDSEDMDSRVQGGLLADGVNSFLAALFTSPPNTTFSQNNGVIALTRCGSWYAGLCCAAWLFIFGVLGKFAGVISSIPDCVLGGMTTFLFANVMISGIAILGKDGISRRDRFILALALGVGVGVACEPHFFEGGGLATFFGKNAKFSIGFWPAEDVCDEFYNADRSCANMNGRCCMDWNDDKKMWRDSIIMILKTPYCVGTLLAMFLNAILPFDKDEEVQEKKKGQDKGDVNPLSSGW